MLVDFYPSARKAMKYLVVPAGTKFENWQPQDANLDDDFREVGPKFKTTDISANDHLIGIDSGRVISELQTKGWSIVAPTITTSVRMGPQRGRS